MPFGLMNAAMTFQALMNKIFKGLIHQFMLVFFYDIFVYSATIVEHVPHLHVVFSLLQEQKLFANRKKCCFSKRELEYLDHIVSEQGVVADLEKVQIMDEWPIPKSPKELRGFLGITGYYRRFV